MKTYKTIQKDVEVIDQHTCDICGEDLTKRELFDASEVTIEAKIGSWVPEGDLRTKYSIDICEDCFEYKIIPYIEEKFEIKFKEEY